MRKLEGEVSFGRLKTIAIEKLSPQQAHALRNHTFIGACREKEKMYVVSFNLKAEALALNAKL